MWGKVESIKQYWRKVSQLDPYKFSNDKLFKHVIRKILSANEKNRLQIISFLIDELHQPNSVVRYHAACALGKIGERLVAKPLNVTLNDKNEGVGKGAAYNPGQLGASEAIEPLIQVMCSDPDNNVRMMAEWALEKFGNVAIRGLISLFIDETNPEMTADNLGKLLHNANPDVRFLTVKPLVTQEKFMSNGVYYSHN